MAARKSGWPRLAILVHLLVVAVASWQLSERHGKPVYAFWATISGLSLFVLTGLVHEASHRLLARSFWLNELGGNLAGWLVLTPLTAYRAFHLKHHQTTNEVNDPNTPLNSRWMLGIGSFAYVILIHKYALGNLGGRLRWRYWAESLGMLVFLSVLVLLPRALRERAWLLPIGIVVLFQNIRIVTEHLDLGSERYRDTWQLVLPGWLSRWILHYDHHLEHHLRPGLHWHELPGYREDLTPRAHELGLLRVTFSQYFRDIFLARKPKSIGPTVADDTRFDTARGQRHRVDKPDPQMASTPAGERYHGLDALRGVTMLLVVVLHAALAYAVVPIPNLIWVVHDFSAHPAFDVLCWWTLGISSPFYLMSGFFAAELTAARGLSAFAVSRAKRILMPLIVAGITILPTTFFIWVAGWLISGQCTPREFLRMKFHARGYQQNLYGPAHLWSLEYLALMLAAYAAWLLIRPLLPRHRREDPSNPGWLSRWLVSPWRPVLLAVPTTLILWAGHAQVGLDAIMDRTNSFMPEPFRFVHNLIFFAVGIVLHRWRHDLGRLAGLGWTYLALSIPVFACRAFFVQRDLIQPIDSVGVFLQSASGAVFSWLITFGLLGLSLGLLSRPRPILQYLADSSYWVYLCHLPIIGLLQVDLFSLKAPAALKFAVVLMTTLALCLASYQVMVRHTILGRWLHGRRDRPIHDLRSRSRFLRLKNHYDRSTRESVA